MIQNCVNYAGCIILQSLLSPTSCVLSITSCGSILIVLMGLPIPLRSHIPMSMNKAKGVRNALRVSCYSTPRVEQGHSLIQSSIIFVKPIARQGMLACGQATCGNTCCPDSSVLNC